MMALVADLKEFYKGKRVFITGHTGFKGSWLSEMLIMLGADVYGYALEPPTKPSLYELMGLGKRLNSVIGDIRDFERLKELEYQVDDPQLQQNHHNPK